MIVFGLTWLLEPRAMRVQPGAVGGEALKTEEQQPSNGERPRPSDEATIPDPQASPSEGPDHAYLRG